MMRLLTRMWRHVPGVHPGMESLIAHIHGLAAPEVQEHLIRCRECRTTVQLLQAAAQAARNNDPAVEERVTSLLHDTYESLDGQMRAWCSLAERLPRHRVHKKQGRSQRLFNAFEFYFGNEAARRLDCARRDAADQLLISSAKPFFTAFLGRKAADALAREIAGVTT